MNTDDLERFCLSNDGITAILVVQGAEYQAVCRGLQQVRMGTPPVLAIPMGCQSLIPYLKKLQNSGYFSHHRQPSVLLMGLGGSLSSLYSVGDVVVYQSCGAIDGLLGEQIPLPRSCDRLFTDRLSHKFKQTATLVRGLTSDRLIHSAAEKRLLGEKYSADVVDMEGLAALEVLQLANVAVAMVRVISDDAHHDIPDLTDAIAADGSLQPLPLAIRMIQQPIAATRLIRGSLKGLKRLQEITTFLFN